MALSLAEPADEGSVDLTLSTVDDGASMLTVKPQTTVGSNFGWYYFTIGGANTRTPIIDLLSTGYFNGLPPASGALHGTWSYDGLTWFSFDNVSFLSTPSRIRFSNNAAFTQNTVHVAHRATFTWARMEAKILEWMASSYTSPTASGDVNGVLTTLPEVSNGYGRMCPAAKIYAFRVTDPAATGPKNSCILNHTVHVGELPGTYAFVALIDLLLSNDPRAVFLRKYWNIYAYPCINPQGRYGGLYRTAPDGSSDVWDSPNWPPLTNVIKPAITLDSGGAPNAFFDFHSYNHNYIGNNYLDFSNGVDDYQNPAWATAIQNHEAGHTFWVSGGLGGDGPMSWAGNNLNPSNNMKVLMIFEAGCSSAYGVPEYQRFGKRIVYTLAHMTERGSFPVTALDTAGKVIFS